MPDRDTEWRGQNLGCLLLSATDVFMREKLHAVHADGFVQVAEVHMALVQSLDLHGTRLTEIAARAGMTKPSMLELVDKAERLGLVERRPDLGDKRAKVVIFTPAGLRMLSRLRQGIAKAERRITAAMGAEFVARLKERLAAYAATAGIGQTVWDGGSKWRTGNAGRWLAAAARVFVRDVLRVVHEDGFGRVSEVQLRLFRHIDLDGTRLTEIAARAKTTKQAAAELLGKAETLGLVTRQPDPMDGRAKIVTFTPAGLNLLDGVRKGTEIAERRAADVLGKAFVAEMRAQLVPYISKTRQAAPQTTDARRPVTVR